MAPQTVGSWQGREERKVEENETEEPFRERVNEANTGSWVGRKGGSMPNRLKATEFVSVVERRGTRGTGCSR